MPDNIHPEVKAFFARISSEGGIARAKKLTAKRRKEIALMGARKRAENFKKKKADAGKDDQV